MTERRTVKFRLNHDEYRGWEDGARTIILHEFAGLWDALLFLPFVLVGIPLVLFLGYLTIGCFMNWSFLDDGADSSWLVSIAVGFGFLCFTAFVLWVYAYFLETLLPGKIVLEKLDGGAMLRCRRTVCGIPWGRRLSLSYPLEVLVKRTQHEDAWGYRISLVDARKRRFRVTLPTGVRSSKRRVRKAGEEIAKSLADILECTWTMKGWDK